MVKKNLAPEKEGVRYFPQTSQCIKSKQLVVLAVLTENGNLVCLDFKKESQKLFLDL